MTASLRELDLREFGDWPLRYRAAACGLVALLAWGLPWMLLTRPTLAEWQGLVAAESELQVRLIQTRQQADVFPPLPPEATVPTVLLPPDLPVLMTAITETASAAGLRNGQLRPQPAKEIGADTEAESIPRIELRFYGTWPQMSRFACDLAATTWDAILGLHEIRLRTHGTTSLLELSASVRIHPRPETHLLPFAVQPDGEISGRNPFGDAATHASRTHTHVLIGSIGNEHGQVGLFLSADGRLRRVAASPAERGKPRCTRAAHK